MHMQTAMRVAWRVDIAMTMLCRLGADCVLRTVPFQILGKIVRHAKDLEPDSMHISCSERVPIYTMEQLD